MANKISKKLAIIVLISVIGLQVQVHPVIGQIPDNTQVSYNVWNLLQWNNQSDVQWYSKGLFIHAQSGSQITYNITSSTDNATNPNSGLFSIGNVSNLETDNYDLANQFTLSIYPWLPGFVANPNHWSDYETQAKDAASTLNGTIDVSQGIANASNDIFRTSYRFVFNQTPPDGNQNTTLIYDHDTGVLIYAYTEFYFGSLYIMEVELSSSTLVTGSNYQQTPGFTLAIPIVLLITLGVLKKKKILFK